METVGAPEACLPGIFFYFQNSETQTLLHFDMCFKLLILSQLKYKFCKIPMVKY